MVYDERDEAEVPEHIRRDVKAIVWSVLGIVLIGGGLLALCALGVIREAAVQQ